MHTSRSRPDHAETRALFARMRFALESDSVQAQRIVDRLTTSQTAETVASHRRLLAQLPVAPDRERATGPARHTVRATGPALRSRSATPRPPPARTRTGRVVGSRLRAGDDPAPGTGTPRAPPTKKVHARPQRFNEARAVRYDQARHEQNQNRWLPHSSRRGVVVGGVRPHSPQPRTAARRPTADRMLSGTGRSFPQTSTPTPTKDVG